MPLARSTLPFVAAAALLAVVPAHAGNAACVIGVEEADPLADREALLGAYEKLPQHCLKAIFHQCTAEAGRTFLDLGSAAMCSFGYEALLRQGFGGNFQALMAWWRSERGEPTAR